MTGFIWTQLKFIKWYLRIRRQITTRIKKFVHFVCFPTNLRTKRTNIVSELVSFLSPDQVRLVKVLEKIQKVLEWKIGGNFGYLCAATYCLRTTGPRLHIEIFDGSPISRRKSEFFFHTNFVYWEGSGPPCTLVWLLFRMIHRKKNMSPGAEPGEDQIWWNQNFFMLFRTPELLWMKHISGSFKNIMMLQTK